MTDLSVVIPVYNEADAVEALVEDLGRELLPIAPDRESESISTVDCRL